MRIKHFGGIEIVSTLSEFESILNLRYGENANEFWITKNEIEENPCLAILVKDNYANVTFFPNYDHMGFQSLSPDDSEKDDEYMVFYTNTPEEEIEVSTSMVVAWDSALEAAKEFFTTLVKPTCLEWEEL